MPRTVLIPPRQHCWVESDAYDRSAFAALAPTRRRLPRCSSAAACSCPTSASSLEDVFCLLFKLQPSWRAADEVALASALNRELLAALRDHPLLESVRAESQLDEVKAGLGTLLLSEHLLTLLREERLLTRGDLLDLWDLEHREEELRRARRGAERGRPQRRWRSDTRGEAERAAAAAEGELRQKAVRVAERLAEMPSRARAAIPAGLGGLRRELAETTEQAQSWGTGLGAGGRHSPGRQIELGRRLATNPKLRRLAALVGRMREQALALRRSRFERASEEMFDVELGRDARPPAAAGAARAAPSRPAPRLPAPSRGGTAAVLSPARRRRARPRADDRLSRRLLVDGRREGDLVQGGRADAARDRAAPAAAVSLRLLLVARHAALHARPEPARSSPGARRARPRRGRVLPRRRHRLRGAARRRARDAGARRATGAATSS